MPCSGVPEGTREPFLWVPKGMGVPEGMSAVPRGP